MKRKTNWRPLLKRDWNHAAARHLASRLGFSIHPKIVDTIHDLGPEAATRRFLESPSPMPEPTQVSGMKQAEEEFDPRAMRGQDDRRDKRKELQKLSRESYVDYAIEWYRFSSDANHGPQEKLVSFFQDVWAVSYQGVKSTPALFDYQSRIRSSLTGSYIDMCANLATSPAVMRYLDLQKNRKGAPNENFARELFELFTLGEGNYTETDIKEAARALTGYTFDRDRDVVFRPNLHDEGRKTVFGKEGRFKMEDILNLVFSQSAAARFLPREFCRYYLSDAPLDEQDLDDIADIWRSSGYSLPVLYRTVFTSTLFYEPRYRANLIKSPNQFYIGLLQDLELDTLPLARATVRAGRSMGQPFLNPPNVRGWVGGRNWINSATLAARAQVVDFVLSDPEKRKLNADEVRALEAAKEAGYRRFSVDPESLRKSLGSDKPAPVALAERLYPDGNASLLEAVAADPKKPASALSEKELLSLLRYALSAPSYHLC